MENNYVVYMHTLKLDSRKYIGITCQNPKKRWCNGKGYQNNAYFYRSIEKYGWDNFKHDIIFEGQNKESACLKEQALIKLFNTTDDRFGFNHTPGGEHYEITPEVREKLKLTSTKIFIAKENLQYQYIDLNKTMEECAKYFSCSIGCIQQNLYKYDIQIKKRNRYIPAVTRLDITKERLCYQYIALDKNFESCAEYFNCSAALINKLCRKYGLTKHPNKGKKLNFSKEDLFYEYIELDLTQQQLAELYGCDRRTISKYLKNYNIKKLKN